MRTPPPDLPVEHVAAELRRAWGLPVADLTYQPLGFGSHHWLVRGTDGSAWFATADDLTAFHRHQDLPGHKRQSCVALGRLVPNCLQQCAELNRREGR